MFVDSRDVIVQVFKKGANFDNLNICGGQADKLEITRRFLSTGADILFNAEDNCFPYTQWSMNL